MLYSLLTYFMNEISSKPVGDEFFNEFMMVLVSSFEICFIIKYKSL